MNSTDQTGQMDFGYCKWSESNGRWGMDVRSISHSRRQTFVLFGLRGRGNCSLTSHWLLIDWLDRLFTGVGYRSGCSAGQSH